MAMHFFGIFFGALLSGALQDATSLQATLLVAGCVHTLTVFIALCLEESVRPARTPDQVQKRQCCLFSNVAGIKDSMMILFRERKNGTRPALVILLLVAVVNTLCQNGDKDVTVLFVQRSPLGWPRSWYSYYEATQNASLGLSLLVIVPFFSGVLHIRDSAILLIGIISDLLRRTWIGFCTRTWMMYVAVVIGFLRGIMLSATRSLISKTVEDDEVGKAFSVLANAETVSKCLGSLVFISIYAATVDYFAGSTFLVMAFIVFILFFVVLWMHLTGRAEQPNKMNISVAAKTNKDHGTKTGDKENPPEKISSEA